jgi:spore germination cell wall hydrolase CwlJ-like protein
LYAILRAAGFAAAAVGAAFSPALADPFQSFDLKTPHAAAGFTKYLPDAAEPLAADAGPVIEPETITEDTIIAPVVEQPEPAAPAEVPPVSPGRSNSSKRSLLALVDEYASTRASSAELECLAGAIYFESKGEPLSGQLAVAEVIINRTKSGRYPTSMCGVVKQRGQFSFVRAGRLPPIPKQSAHWRKAVAIAHIALKDLADSPASNALSFHATYVSPRWRMKRVATVGNHIFYR